MGSRAGRRYTNSRWWDPRKVRRWRRLLNPQPQFPLHTPFPLLTTPYSILCTRRGLPALYSPFQTAVYFEHLRIPVGAGSLHAERLGRGGPPVLLLHGFGTCTFLWRHLSPVLAQAGFTCIALDLLGQGESDRPDESAVSLTAQAEYLARAIAALRLTDVTIVGQDVGAIAALLLAAAPKGRVESVVLLSPPDPDDLPGPDIRNVQRASARVALSTNTLFAAKALLEPLLQGAVANPVFMPERLVARYLAPYVGSEGVTQLLQAAAAVELSPEARTSLAALDCPVLVVNGLADGPRPSLSWPSVLPSAPVTIERLPDVGRLIPEEAPEALAPLLLRWLRRQRSD